MVSASSAWEKRPATSTAGAIKAPIKRAEISHGNDDHVRRVTGAASSCQLRYDAIRRQTVSNNDGITDDVRKREEDYFRRKDRELIERMRSAAPVREVG